MGTIWSSSADQISNIPVIEWTRWDSPPNGMLFDSFALSISLTDDSHTELRKRNANGVWNIVFEIDVAHLQKRINLITVPVSLESKIQRFEISGKLIKDKLTQDSYSVSDLSNVCSIHSELSLIDVQQPIATSTVILDVSGERFQECHSPDELQRRAYGALVDEDIS